MAEFSASLRLAQKNKNLGFDWDKKLFFHIS